MPIKNLFDVVVVVVVVVETRFEGLYGTMHKGGEDVL